MAMIKLCDLENNAVLDQKARERIFGGEYGSFGYNVTAVNPLLNYHARNEGIGTFCNDDGQLVQRFQPVYIEVYEVRGESYDRPFIGPVCVPG